MSNPVKRQAIGGKSLPAAKRALRKKAIAREFDQKRRELGLDSAPVMKRGLGFYLMVLVGMVFIGAIVLQQADATGKRKTVNTKTLYAQRSVDALAEALGRFKFHCGCYPTEADGGLAALSAKKSRYPGWLGPYAGSWGAMIPDPWKRPYVYEPGSNGVPVVLSLGADGIRGTADDVVPDERLFDKPFRDVSWTNDWVHFSRRGIIVVPKKSSVPRP